MAVESWTAARDVRNWMSPSATPAVHANIKLLYVRGPAGRKGRKLNEATEHFVDEIRMGAN